jgi:hypothetical protein
MEVVNGLGGLVDDVAFMLLTQHVLPNECIEVDVHVFEQDVDVFLVHGSDNFFGLDYVGVVEFFEVHDLSEGALCIR